MAEQTILIAEDDPDIRDGVRILLSGEGYHIIEAENGTRALEVFRPEVDLVILDIMMPGMSGLRVCEELRKLSTVPILFLTAKSQESDKLLGLTAGGDDYLPKPFSFAELSARVKALLRRYCVYQGKGQAPARAENLTLCSHGVKLALDCNRVWVDGEEIDLTETEYKILRLLMQSPQRIFPVQVIYEDVWQEPYFYTSNGTVMVHIRNLRMKIEKDPQNPARLQTMWGKGTALCPGRRRIMRKKLGLSGKLVLMILFSALASAVFLVGMQVVLNKALWLYFDQPETQQKAVEKQVQELQSYIDRRGLSSRDIDKLDDWSVRNGSTMFIIYDRSRMLYSSYPLVAPVYEGRENVTETVPAERWLPMYSLTFSDKEATAMFYYNGVDAYYGKGCEILLLVSFALFPLFFFLSSRKIIRYILLLSGEIQAMEGGDLDHPITIQGDDELALLATSLDGLRLTLRQQQAEEAQAAAKVKSLITEMSHDLRTPLTTLLLYTEILRHHKYETEAQQDEYLAKIDGKARQIKQLSDNLFEYALVTRDTVVQLDAPARFSQIFEEPLAEMVEMLQQRGFACALELGSEDVLLTVRAQYIRRILDNIGSNLIKYADPARPIEVRFLRQEGRAGLVFRNHVLPAPPAVESTKVGLTSIETMMDKMHADCKIEQENEQFTMTLLFPVE